MTAAEQLTGTLFVANSKGGDVSAVDLATQREVDRITVGGVLDDVVVSPDGSRLYLSRKDVADVVCVTRDGTVEWTCPMPGTPHHVSLSPDARRLYVPIFDSDEAVAVDLAAGRIDARVTVGDGPHGTRLSPDGSILYVGMIYGKAIAVVDTATFALLRRLDFPDEVRPFAADAGARTMYVQQSGLHGFLVVDLATGTIERRVELPELPDGTEPAPYDTIDHGLCLSADDRFLVCAASTGHYAAVYRTSDLALAGVVPVGAAPFWAIAARDPGWAFMSSREEGTVSVLALADEPSEAARVGVGTHPERMFHHVEGNGS